MMAVSLVLSSVERLELEHRCASRYIVNNELIEEFIIMGSNKLKIEIHNFSLAQTLAKVRTKYWTVIDLIWIVCNEIALKFRFWDI